MPDKKNAVESHHDNPGDGARPGRFFAKEKNAHDKSDPRRENSENNGHR